MRGIPFIVSAPSGSGKTTLCNMAIDFFKDMRHSISYTTRPARAGETDGVDYRFIGDPEFDAMALRGEFLEHAGVHGRRYGTAKKDLEAMLSSGVDVMLDIDVQGAASVKKSGISGVYVFILPPSLKACEERLRSRGKDSPDDIKKRLQTAEREIRCAYEYDYLIVNDDKASAFERLKSIIMAERSKKARMSNRVMELFGI